MLLWCYATGSGSQKMHRCGKECTLEGVFLNGVVCCPVSRMVKGPWVSTTPLGVMEDPLPKKQRVKQEDPEDERRQRADHIFRALFVHSLCLTPEDLQRKTYEALVQAKREGKDWRSLQVTLITPQELEPTLLLALSIAEHVQCEFDAVLCAVLMYQAGEGLTHQAKVIIPPDAKIALLLPRPRTFPSYGLATNLCSRGSSAIALKLDALIRLKPRVEIGSTPLVCTRRRNVAQF